MHRPFIVISVQCDIVSHSRDGKGQVEVFLCREGGSLSKSIKPLLPSGRQMLRWTQPNALVRYHELRGVGGLYATLRWKKMFGSLAVGESNQAKFTFKRAGFLRPYITVRRERLVSDFATLRFASGSQFVNSVTGPNGVLELESGERFAFVRTSIWNRVWAFVNPSRDPLVTFKKRSKVKPEAEVSIIGDPERIPHIDLLLMLGWYAIILDYEEAEAAVGTHPGMDSRGL
jgi:hypothetical protein